MVNRRLGVALRGGPLAIDPTPAAGLAAPLARWLQRGIPDVDANTAGIFRVLFGLAVLMFFQAYPVDSSRLAPSFDSRSKARCTRPSSSGCARVRRSSTGLAVAACNRHRLHRRWLTRLSYALFVAGAIVWAFVAVSFDSTHPHSTLILTLVALLPSRWGDGFSVDRWLHLSAHKPRGEDPGLQRSPPGGATGRHYGYPSGPGTDRRHRVRRGRAVQAGAAGRMDNVGAERHRKYHFITDSVNAPVDWGLQLAAHPNLAILASFGAVAIEALAITAAFTRSEPYRLRAGLAALSLVAGFCSGWACCGWDGDSVARVSAVATIAE